MFGGASFAGNYFGGLLSSASGINPSTLSITVSINSVTVSVVKGVTITPSVLTITSSLNSPTILIIRCVLINPLALISRVILNSVLVMGVLNYDSRTKVSGVIRSLTSTPNIYNNTVSGVINAPKIVIN
jgi:hypothetical protein